jgi:hypothetical protein
MTETSKTAAASFFPTRTTGAAGSIPDQEVIFKGKGRVKGITVTRVGFGDTYQAQAPNGRRKVNVVRQGADLWSEK